MGILSVSSHLRGSEAESIAIEFLIRECNAKVSVKKVLESNTEYLVEGESIPDGYFAVIVKEIAPKVLGLTIVDKNGNIVEQ